MSDVRPTISAFILAISLGAAGTSDVQAAVTPRYVNAANIGPGHVAWIRSGPGISYQKVGYLRSASRHIRAMECKVMARDNWCHVQFQGTRGWIQDRYIRAPHVMSG